MKLTTLRFALAALLPLCFAARGFSQELTPAEKEKALQYLADTRNSLSQAVQGLSDAQWKFKPGPDRWSVAEVVEHLAVLEGLFVKTVQPQIEQSPTGKPGMDVKKIDAIILAKVPDRSTKIQAPPEIVPTGRWSPQESFERFLASRLETINFLSTASNLRGHVLSHPALGPLDGYQWVLAVAAHTERHTKQILEVEADPHFPVKPTAAGLH